MPLFDNFRKGTKEFFHSLAEGWRNLIHRSGNALTRYVPTKKEVEQPEAFDARWGLVVSKVAETGDMVIFRMEIPGMNRDDLDMTLFGNHLIVRRKKRFHKEEKNAQYHLVESDYGAFERNSAASGGGASRRRGRLQKRCPHRPFLRIVSGEAGRDQGREMREMWEMRLS